MTKLLVGQDFNEDLRVRKSAAWYAQRLFWFAEDGDVLVLPTQADDAWARYVTGLTGTRLDTLSIVVPPSFGGDESHLSRQRLRDPEFLAHLHKAIGDRAVQNVFALWPEARVAELARAMGCEAAMPGHGYFSQGGDALANSKAMFRILAAGLGVPIPDGAVCMSQEGAVDTIERLLDRGLPVIVKHEFLSGGWGNEIISRTPVMNAVGARRCVILTGRNAVAEYLDERWHFLTGDGQYRLVVEQYLPDCVAAFAEFSVQDDGIRFGGQGQLFSLPAPGSILPASNIDVATMEAIIDDSHRLCEAMRAIGYRGVLGMDAIVTPDQGVLFTEFNGRATGSTHLYSVLGDKVIGAGFARDRFIVEQFGMAAWSAASFDEAVTRLRDSDLAYDPGTRRGVVLGHAYDTNRHCVPYCIVDECVDAARETEKALAELFDFVVVMP